MKAVERLSGAIKFKTVSFREREKMDMKEFEDFLDYLEESYPLVFQSLSAKRINTYALVLCWKGRSAELPLLLTAHYDVVPASEEGWPYPPFSGKIAENRIWGRGSFDDKGALIALLESVERLLEEGFTPRRDLYFAFGFDEEIGGEHGAKEIAKYFREEKILFEAVLDEGGAVVDGNMMGIQKPIAVIGLAEKGNSSFRFTFHGEEGHSSTPPKHTSIGRMAAFIKDVEESPRPAVLTPTVAGMLKALAPYKKGMEAKLLANPEKYFFLLKKVLLKNPQTAAMLRSTVAFTMTQSGEAPNVLPRKASCIANVRVLEEDRVDEILEWFYSFGHKFKLEILSKEEATPSSSVETAVFKQLKKTIKKNFPDAVLTPYMMTGGTDCRQYQKVVKDSYRFSPCRVSQDELSRMHGRGEYLSIKNLKKMIDFYMDFIREGR